MPALATAASQALRKLFQFRLPNTYPLAAGVQRLASTASALS